MSEIEISGHTYRIGKINAIRQWHIVRRVAPALLKVLSLADLKTAASNGPMDLRNFFDRIEPFLEALGKMTDEDNDYVIENCLEVVDIKVSGDRGWARVSVGGAVMFDEDINLLVMLRLVFEAGRENLEGFFVAFQQMYPGLLVGAEKASLQ